MRCKLTGPVRQLTWASPGSLETGPCQCFTDKGLTGNWHTCNGETIHADGTDDNLPHKRIAASRSHGRNYLLICYKYREACTRTAFSCPKASWPLCPQCWSMPKPSIMDMDTSLQPSTPTTAESLSCTSRPHLSMECAPRSRQSDPEQRSTHPQSKRSRRCHLRNQKFQG